MSPESNFRTTNKITNPEQCNSKYSEEDKFYKICYNRSSLIRILGKSYVLCSPFEGSQCESN